MRKLTLGTDEQLIERCSAGDQAAFDLLFKKYARPLTYFIEQIIHDHDRAEDIFQDTFLRMLKNKEKYDTKYRFSTWIYRIALNLSINELRKRQRENGRIVHKPESDEPDRYLDILDTLSSGDDPYRNIERKDLAEKVGTALGRLPAPKRIAFILKFYHHLSYDEIAGVMGCTRGTIKSRIHYAVEELQILVGE